MPLISEISLTLGCQFLKQNKTKQKQKQKQKTTQTNKNRHLCNIYFNINTTFIHS